MSGYPPPGGFYPAPGQPSAPPYGFQPGPPTYPGSYPVGPVPPPGQPGAYPGGAAPAYPAPGAYPGGAAPAFTAPGAYPGGAAPAYPGQPHAWPGGAVPEHSQGFRLERIPNQVPRDAICLARQTDATGQLYSAVAHTQWGTIPGKAKQGNCWYPYGGKEMVTNDFSWIVCPGATLIKNAGWPPPGALAVGHQTDATGTLYAGVARTKWGTIPGKAKENTCWYSYGGKELFTSDFDWVVPGQGVPPVAPVAPVPSVQPGLGSRRYFFIRSDLHGKVIDVDGENRSPGTAVIMYPRKPGQPAANQLWYQDEQRCIRSRLNDFALQPTANDIRLQPFNGSPNQRWVIHGKKIVNERQPNLCIDIIGQNREDGVRLCQYAYKGTPNQHWNFDYV